MSFFIEIIEAFGPKLPHFKLIQRLAEVAIKYPFRSLILIILIYGGLGFGIYKLDQFDKRKQEEQRQLNLNYSAQLDSLTQTEANLKSLIHYVEDQKVKLRESQDVIVQLESEHARLQPIVEADKKVIDALFEAQETRQMSNRRTGYITSFLLGVVSSLTATFIVYVIAVGRRKRKSA